MTRGTERARMVRHLARIDAHLEAIARSVITAPLPAQDAASLLLALRRVELSLQADLPDEDEDAGVDRLDFDGAVDARPC